MNSILHQQKIHSEGNKFGKQLLSQANELKVKGKLAQAGAISRRRDCHSAAPPLSL